MSNPALFRIPLSGTADAEELTSETAAELLHVSKAHVDSLIDSGLLGAVRLTDSGHLWISKATLLEYKAVSKRRRAKGLDAMVSASRRLGLYEAELEELLGKAGR